MTFSATSLRSGGIQALRAGLTFTTLLPPERPRRLRLRRSGPTLLALTALGLGLILILGPLARAVPPPPIPAPLAPVLQQPLPPAWTDVIRPFQTFDLTGGPYAKLPLGYAAQRDAAGTGRRDTLTFGTPDPGEPFLRLTFYRRGDEPFPSVTIFVDAARLAAGANLAVTRSGLTSTLPTRFGPVETAGVAVARRDRSAACLAFRLADPATLTVLQVTGLACGTDEHPIDQTTLACMVDRLDLVSAGDDEALRAVFVAAERRRGKGCQDHAAALRPGGDEGTAHLTLKGAL